MYSIRYVQTMWQKGTASKNGAVKGGPQFRAGTLGQAATVHSAERFEVREWLRDPPEILGPLRHSRCSRSTRWFQYSRSTQPDGDVTTGASLAREPSEPALRHRP